MKYNKQKQFLLCRHLGCHNWGFAGARHGEGRRRFAGDLRSRSTGLDSGPIQLLRLLHGKAKLHKVQFGLRHSRAKPGHGALAAQRRRPVTGHLGDLQTTGACTKRKRGPGDTLARLGSGRCVMQKCRRRGRAVARWRRSNGVRGEGAAMELRASVPSCSTPGCTRILLRWLWWAGWWWNGGSAPAQRHDAAEHGGEGWRQH